MSKQVISIKFSDTDEQGEFTGVVQTQDYGELYINFDDFGSVVTVACNDDHSEVEIPRDLENEIESHSIGYAKDMDAEARDYAAFKRNPLGYHGVRTSDFIRL